MIAKATSLGNVTEASLNKSLAQFKRFVKDFKAENKIQYSIDDTQSREAVRDDTIGRRVLQEPEELGLRWLGNEEEFAQREQEKNSFEKKKEVKFPRLEYSQDQLSENASAVVQMEPVYYVDEKALEKSGKHPREIYKEAFEGLGGVIHTEDYGDVALKNSSIRSEIRHGTTAEKIASIPAIPAVLQKGRVIDSKRKSGSFADRIVICAPIRIGQGDYYMGVMLQRDQFNQRLYIHDVILEKEASISSEADLITTGADEENENLLLTTIMQKALSVKEKFSFSNEEGREAVRDDVISRLPRKAADAVERTERALTQT